MAEQKSSRYVVLVDDYGWTVDSEYFKHAAAAARLEELHDAGTTACIVDTTNERVN